LNCENLTFSIRNIEFPKFKILPYSSFTLFVLSQGTSTMPRRRGGKRAMKKREARLRVAEEVNKSTELVHIETVRNEKQILCLNLSALLNYCQICNTKRDESERREVYLSSHLVGWGGCVVCYDKVMIPGIVAYLEHNQMLPIPPCKYFYRYRTESLAEISLYGRRLIAFKKRGCWWVNLQFIDAMNDGTLASRSVSLENLIYHNDGLLDAIRTSRLLADIRFGDFAPSLRGEIVALALSVTQSDGVFAF
jgi:hypothetical protein